MNNAIFCNNCDNEATRFYRTEKGAPFFLCHTYASAFELGQANSEVVLEDIGSLHADEDGE